MNIKEICEAVIRLYLYADNTKMIHYSTSGSHYHKLCDDIRDCILKFADEFAEQSFGYYGKPNYSDFKLNLPIKQTEDLGELCDNVLGLLKYYRKEMSKESKMLGVVSLIDDFSGEIGKLKFLTTFDRVVNKR